MLGLDLEIKLRTLAGTSVNGVPVIANREYKGSINLEDGEPAVVASSVTQSEQYSMMGIPGLNSIPVLNKIATTNNKTEEDDEISGGNHAARDEFGCQPERGVVAARDKSYFPSLAAKSTSFCSTS